jgi:hypothetical protein
MECSATCSRSDLLSERRLGRGEAAGVTIDQMCEVTVVIPTHNRARFLPGALRSALSQVDVSYEIRVVDDGSTDGTAQLLKQCLDHRVKPVRQAEVRGVAAARNRAVSDARGEWLAFLDDDDLWAPTWLRTALRVGRTCGAGLVYGSRWLVDEQRRVLDVAPAAHPSHVRALLAEGRNPLGGPSSVLVRTDVLAAAGGFDERLSALADWEAWLRLLDTCSAAPVPDLLTAYTLHRDNMVVRNPFGVLAEFELFTDIVQTRLGTTKGSVREGSFMHWVATESSRAGHRTRAARFWLRNARRTRKPQHVVRAARALARGRTATATGRAYASPEWLTAVDRTTVLDIGYAATHAPVQC